MQQNSCSILVEIELDWSPASVSSADLTARSMIALPARGSTVTAIGIEAAPDSRHGSEAALGAADVGEEAVRDALRRLLDGPNFEASERNKQFLSYVVEETLAGRA